MKMGHLSWAFNTEVFKVDKREGGSPGREEGMG